MTLLQIKQGSAKEADAVLTAYVKQHGDECYSIATLYAVRGQSDQAFEWLQRAYLQRGGAYVFKINPLWNHLKSDPRFAATVKKMGLAD